MKFLADSSLGRLSRWLRILGHDTAYWRGQADRAFLRMAEKEGRVALTRRRDILEKQHTGTVLFVEADRVEDQIAEIVTRLDLPLRPETFFTICLECNAVLVPASRDEVRPEIPDYVYRTQQEFRRCPGCRRVYWPGTHRKRAMAVLKKLFKDTAEPQASSRKPQGG